MARRVTPGTPPPPYPGRLAARLAPAPAQATLPEAADHVLTALAKRTRALERGAGAVPGGASSISFGDEDPPTPTSPQRRRGTWAARSGGPAPTVAYALQGISALTGSRRLRARWRWRTGPSGPAEQHCLGRGGAAAARLGREAAEYGRRHRARITVKRSLS